MVGFGAGPPAPRSTMPPWQESKMGPVPTLIRWDGGGGNVYVMGSWDNWKRTPLEASGNTHSVVLSLLPGSYHIYFYVDDKLRAHPKMAREYDKHVCVVNFFHVVPEHPYNTLQAKPLPQNECLAAITFQHISDSVLVEGSWDRWAGRLEMTKSGYDHHLLLSLLPGRYHYRFIVGGEIKLGAAAVEYHEGYPVTNILDVKPVSGHSLFYGTNTEVLIDFMAKPENQVVTICNFNVGSSLGSIAPEVKMCPCTDTGYMLTRGFFYEANQAYLRNRSWAGRFKPSDMVVIDKRHCRIKKDPDMPLTRAHILLDNYQLKQSLLLRFEKNGKFPPYFSHLFWLLENPPEDFDTNKTSRDEYIDHIYKNAALATPPERMLALVTVAQYFKSLRDNDKSTQIREFNKLMRDYSGWYKTAFTDKLLKEVYLDSRAEKIDVKGDPVAPEENSGLKCSNFLRVFFVHGPEHTLVDLNAPTQSGADPTKDNKVDLNAPTQSGADPTKDNKATKKRKKSPDNVNKKSEDNATKLMQQLLKSHTESDLIIAHYYDQLVAKLLVLVREKIDLHPLKVLFC